MLVPIIIGIIAFIVFVILLVIILVVVRKCSAGKSGMSYVNMGPSSKVRTAKHRGKHKLGSKVKNDSSQINIGGSNEVKGIEVPSHSSKTYSGSVELDSAKNVSNSSNSFLKNRFLGFYIALGALQP